MLWDRREVERVARRWADWATDAPEDVTTMLRVLDLPLLPELPPEVSGRQLVCIDGAVLGDDDRGRALLAGLRELRPQVDTFRRVPAASLTRLHLDPEGRRPWSATRGCSADSRRRRGSG